MGNYFHFWAAQLIRGGITALLWTILFVSPAQASWVYFRNDTNYPVVVQGVGVVNRVLKAGPRHTLQPGEVSRDLIVTPGKKLFIIADAKQPTRILFRDTVLCLGADLYFSIQPDPPPAVKANAKAPAKLPARKAPPPVPTKVNVVPTKPYPIPEPAALKPASQSKK
jgi:hypothetical protein